MNVSQQSSRGVLYVAFNQDQSCISIGTRDGFKIFNCDTSAPVYDHVGGAMSIVEMLFCTSLVALVGAGEQPSLSPRRLRLLNTSAQPSTPTAELNFVSSILAVRMNRKRLVVVLDKKVYIHDLSELTVLDTLDTCPNPKGICALSPNAENCHLALPGSTSVGAVLVYDALNLQTLCQIEAHLSPLAVVAFSSDGSLLASASEKGTVIRVHSIPQANKLFTFRRGTYPAAVYSLAFGPPSGGPPSLLAATSETGTLHVFRLATVSKRRSGAGMAVGLLASVMPDAMADIMDSERCFATIRNGSPPGVRSLCAIVGCALNGEDDVSTPATRHDRVRVLVVTADGYFNEYQVNLGPSNNGLFRLERECALIEGAPQQISMSFV